MRKGKRIKWAAAAMALFLTGGAVFGGAAMTMPITVRAEETTIPGGIQATGSLTIYKKADDADTSLAGAKFAIYKVMSLTPGTTAGEYASYEIESEFKTTLNSITPDALNNYSASELEKKINELAARAMDTTSPVTPTASGETAKGTGECTFSNLDLGYYLVVETEAPQGYVTGRPFLVAIPSTDNYNNNSAAGTSWVYDVSASPKNSGIPITKKLADGQDGSVKQGDYVKYVVTTEIPVYDATYVNDVTFKITDVMSDGLEIQNDTDHPVKVKVEGAEVTESSGTYSVTAANVTGEEADLMVDFASAYIKNNGGKTVELTYYAKVTEKAVTGTPGNPNEANIIYNNKPDQTTSGTPSIVKVYSFNINVVKFTNEDTTKALAGAEFALYDNGDLADGHKIGNATTNDDGTISFARLDEGTYYLKETKAPAGYTLLANPIKVEIIAAENSNDLATGGFTLKVDDKEIVATEGTFVTKHNQGSGTSTIAVENHKGFSLPHTGGTGIAIFLIIGLAGIAVISVAITAKTKKIN